MTSHIQEIISVSNEIYDKGLVFGKSGNISKRIKSSIGDIVAITPTLTSLSDLKPEDVVLVDMQGNALTNGTPSSEVNMHLKIYAKRPDVNAIVHTHSAYATGFAYTDKRIKRVEGFKKIKNDPYLHFIEYEKPGSEELAINASENIENDDLIFIDAKTVPENFTGKIRKESPTHLIIVDACLMGSEPGNMEIVDKDDFANIGLSTHSMSLSFFVKYLEKDTDIGIIFVGIEPESMDWADAPTEKVENTAYEFIDALKGCIL